LAVGLLLYGALRKVRLSLPQRIFHLEEAVLAILVGLLLVWSVLFFA
jgi:hypothetical protein